MQPKDKFLGGLMLRQAGSLSLSLRRTSRTPKIFWYISSKNTNADINLFPLISKHRRNNLSGKIVSKLKMCPRVVFLSWFVVPRSCEHVKVRLAEHEVAIHPAIGSMYLVSIISKVSIYRYLPLHQITRSKSGPVCLGSSNRSISEKRSIHLFSEVIQFLNDVCSHRPTISLFLWMWSAC